MGIERVSLFLRVYSGCFLDREGAQGDYTLGY